MRRDADLSRAILFYIEEHSPPQGGLEKPIDIPGYDQPTILAHTDLLIDEGLVDGKTLEGAMGPIQVVIRKLTPDGHNAIAAIRNETIWAKAKKYALDKGVGLTLGVLIPIAKAEVGKHLGLP